MGRLPSSTVALGVNVTVGVGVRVAVAVGVVVGVSVEVAVAVGVGVSVERSAVGTDVRSRCATGTISDGAIVTANGVLCSVGRHAANRRNRAAAVNFSRLLIVMVNECRRFYRWSGFLNRCWLPGRQCNEVFFVDLTSVIARIQGRIFSRIDGIAPAPVTSFAQH